MKHFRTLTHYCFQVLHLLIPVYVNLTKLALKIISSNHQTYYLLPFPRLQNRLLMGCQPAMRPPKPRSSYMDWFIDLLKYISTGNYMLKVTNRNTKTRCEICSKLTIKIQNDVIGVFLVSLLLTLNIFHDVVLVSLLLTLNIFHGVVLVSLLLTLNIFHTQCFCC